MARKRKKAGGLPEDVTTEVRAIVDSFNQETLDPEECYYEARFKGKHCYLDRCDYGRVSPICRLTHTGKMDAWGFAIFKWSSETYEAGEWFFPGEEFVDGTIEGAMKAGLEAYPP